MRGRGMGSDLSRRALLLLFVLLPATLLSLVFAYGNSSSPGGSHAARVPMAIGEWDGRDVELDEATYRLLETRDVLFRVYSKPDTQPVVFCIVVSRDNRRGFHAPEVCFIGGAWEVTEKKRKLVRTDLAERPFLEVARLRIEKQGVRRLVYYWFRTGRFHTPSYYFHQLHVIWNHLAQRGAAGSMIRLDTRVGPGESERDAEARLESFLRDALPRIWQDLPQ